jgi:S1-C subfamily serine protease
VPRSLTAYAAVAAAIAVVVWAALALAGALDENGQPPPPPAAAQQNANSARLLERVRAGLAQIAVRGPGEGRSGTAFMIDREGYLLTDRHLVLAAREVAVHAEGANGPSDAEVVGTDPATNLALLKIPRDDARNLEPVRLGDDTSVRAGQPVLAVGAPFALDGAVTSGVISALDQQLEAPGGLALDGALETNARVEPGNAGGPLVDGGGVVIGVNTPARRPGGRGFAIPIGTAQQVVAAIKDRGDLHTPSLGAATARLGPGLAQLLGLTVEHGLLVRSVAPGGPAALAGIRPARPGRPVADVLVSVDGQAVREPRDVEAALLDRKAGQRVAVEVARGSRRLRLRLAVAPR